MFDHELLSKSPALVALENIAEPRPAHVRACLLELVRIALRQQTEIEQLRRVESDLVKLVARQEGDLAGLKHASGDPARVGGGR